ncbi:DUF305 domain-containing protein [Dermacoccaceae bacterium W4C1]
MSSRPAPGHAVGIDATEDATATEGIRGAEVSGTDADDRDAAATRAQSSGPGRRTALIALVAVLAAVALFVAGWFVGKPKWPDDLSADAGFARDMQVHHAQAVDMSLIVRTKNVDSGVMTLAYDIATTQANQQGQMRGWLETWGLSQARSDEPMEWMTRAGHGHDENMAGMTLSADGRMPGMATEAQLTQLRNSSGRSAAVLYLQLMTVHHRAGVKMAQACVSLCQNSETTALARTMVRGQQSEINLMTGMLRNMGASVPSA